MEKVIELNTNEQIKAYTDPYRIEILFHYYQMNRPATVKEIADKMKETPAKIHYHVKKLEKNGILKLMHTKEVNGIIAKYYEPTAKEFRIKKDRYIDDSVITDVTSMISKAYRMSEKIFVEQINKSQEDKKQRGGNVSSETLYLTQEEAEVLKEKISEFIAKYTDPKRCENLESYHYFWSIISMLEDEDMEKELPKEQLNKENN